MITKAEIRDAIMPAFTYDFLVRPEKRYMPDNNGAGDYSYFLNHVYGEEKIFHTSCKDISKEDMGIFAECVFAGKRDHYPLCGAESGTEPFCTLGI